jgi:hypothetical protein
MVSFTTLISYIVPVNKQSDMPSGFRFLEWIKGLLSNPTAGNAANTSMSADPMSAPATEEKDISPQAVETTSESEPVISESQTKMYAAIGMTWITERDWWFNYTSERYTGKGAIVDLGCWFGSTTIALAEGLSKNPSEKARDAKIEAMDLFKWKEWMEYSVKGSVYEGRFKDDDDFQEVFLEITAPYRNNIVCTKADLSKYRWKGGDIEFLLVDAMKSWKLSNNIQRSFYPFLVPGLSVLLHQDFAHYYPIWIHLHQYRLREYFNPLPDTIQCNSLAFEYVKRIPPELLEKPLSIDDFTPSEIEDAFAYSLSLVAPVNIPHVKAAHVMAVHAKQGREYSEGIYNTLAGEYPDHYVLTPVRDSIGIIQD